MGLLEASRRFKLRLNGGGRELLLFAQSSLEVDRIAASGLFLLLFALSASLEVCKGLPSHILLHFLLLRLGEHLARPVVLLVARAAKRRLSLPL